MRERSASETATAASLLRAAHQVLDARPPILEDPVSVGLVPGSREDEIREQAERLELGFLRALRASFVLRSRIAEDALRRAAVAAPVQYVLLGAGFDTFAYRQPSWARSVRIFELDHPATQEIKQSRLHQRGVETPTNLRFCPIDFERETLLAVLERAGFEAEHPAFFSWLGVIPYLTTGAVENTLRAIAGTGAPTTLVLSYVVPDSHLTGVDAQVVSVSSASAAQRGEPWLSRFEPAELEGRLRSLGYAPVDHLGPEEYESMFLTGRADALPVPCFERVIVSTTGVPAPA